MTVLLPVWPMNVSPCCNQTNKSQAYLAMDLKKCAAQNYCLEFGSNLKQDYQSSSWNTRRNQDQTEKHQLKLAYKWKRKSVPRFTSDNQLKQNHCDMGCSQNLDKKINQMWLNRVRGSLAGEEYKEVGSEEISWKDFAPLSLPIEEKSYCLLPKRLLMAQHLEASHCYPINCRKCHSQTIQTK